LIESLESFIRNLDAGNQVNNVTNSILFIGKISEKLVEKSLDTIPSGEFGSEVFLSNGKISLSLLSESFGIGDVLDALSKGSSVFDDSLSGLINGSLRDGHEVGVSGELVSFSSFGVGDRL